jgi:hypothetical protein
MEIWIGSQAVLIRAGNLLKQLAQKDFGGKQKAHYFSII